MRFHSPAWAKTKRLKINFETRRAFAADLSDATLDADAKLKYAGVAETLGKSLKLRNRISESLDAYREALEAAEDARQLAPKSLQAQYLTATYAIDVAQTKVELGDRQAALVKYNFAREIVDRLCDQSPQCESYLGLKVDLAMQTAEIHAGNTTRDKRPVSTSGQSTTLIMGKRPFPIEPSGADDSLLLIPRSVNSS